MCGRRTDGARRSLPLRWFVIFGIPWARPSVCSMPLPPTQDNGRFCRQCGRYAAVLAMSRPGRQETSETGRSSHLDRQIGLVRPDLATYDPTQHIGSKSFLGLKTLFLTMVTMFGVRDNEYRRELIDQCISIEALSE